MCSGRVDLEFILRAFSTGQDGVLIGGCKLGECNYVTHGNFDALANTYICKKLMEFIGMNPDRLRIQFMSGADGNLLAEVTDDFTKQIREMGPLGKAEGEDPEGLKSKIDAVRKLVPYIRLVERERFRIPVKTKQNYEKFYASDEFNKLFKELILDKITIGQIMSLLEEKPLTTGEISENLGLNPSELSKHISISTRHGYIRYDMDAKKYAIA